MRKNSPQQNIPIGWKQVALGDLVSITTGSRDANHGSPDGQYPFFTCAQKVSKIDEFSFDAEAVLIAGNGDFNVKYYSGKFDAYQRTYVLSEFQNTTGPFVYQKTKQALNDIMRNNQGSSVKFIKMGDLTDYKFILPPINEQQKISEILGGVDEDIEIVNKLIMKNEKLKKGLMQQLFTRGIGHTKFKETELGEVPEMWELRQLRDVTNFANGKAHERDISEDGYYVVVNSKFISTDGKVAKRSDKNLSPLGVGDIAMVMSDVPNGKAIAKCFYVLENNKYTLNQRICSLRAKNMDSRFLFYVVNRNKYFLKHDDGVGQTNLRKDEVLNCPVQVPPIKEQKEIVGVIEAVDEKISVNKKLKEKLALLKKGLMQDLLSGEVRTNI